MLFITELFLAFFISVYVIFWLLPQKLRSWFLLAASLLFYASWSVPFTFHLLAVLTVNYLGMELWRKSRSQFLFVSLQTANILNIAFFKYFYFFADAAGQILGTDWLQDPQLRLSHRAVGNEILLPLAISFYTFQVMAYGIDIKRGVYDTRHSFQEFLLFIAFFPQLIAGPIMRSGDLLPQVRKLNEGSEWSADSRMRMDGIWLIILGVFKKVVVADQLLRYSVTMIAGASVPGEMKLLPENYDSISVWTVIIGSIIMLYVDFSAYTDMARGFGKMLGFEIPINFRAPFLMHSISEFWRRWHLTFSLWIRDYIFIPLGGSRVSEYRVYLNYFLTFLIGGLWHGANWTFVVWGGLMGLYISFENFLNRRGFPEWPESIAGRVFRVSLGWVVLVFSGTLFFAPDIWWSLSAARRMILWEEPSHGLQSTGDYSVVLYSLAAAVFFHIIEEKPGLLRRVTARPLTEKVLMGLSASVLIFMLIEFAGGPADFFYFQF